MYAKVFSSLWAGTLHGHGIAQLVFIYLLAHADADGNVRCVTKRIATDTGFDLDSVNAAIGILEGPDESSNSSEESGVRLVRIGACDRWNIVNYLKYRSMVDLDTVRSQTRERVRKHREKRSVTVGNGQKRQVEVEAEVEVEAKKDSCTERSASPPSVPPFILLPTNRKGITYPVTKSDVARLEEFYPGVDVPGQLRAAAGWLEANANRRKTPGGMPSFINRWMAKEQNRGPAGRNVSGEDGYGPNFVED